VRGLGIGLKELITALDRTSPITSMKSGSLPLVRDLTTRASSRPLDEQIRQGQHWSGSDS
jgi:hypothetical protein